MKPRTAPVSRKPAPAPMVLHRADADLADEQAADRQLQLDADALTPGPASQPGATTRPPPGRPARVRRWCVWPLIAVAALGVRAATDVAACAPPDNLPLERGEGRPAAANGRLAPTGQPAPCLTPLPRSLHVA